MARLSLQIPSLFRKPAQTSDRVEKPHFKATFAGMMLVVLSIVCFIMILWIIMTIVRLFSGFAV